MAHGIHSASLDKLSSDGKLGLKGVLPIPMKSNLEPEKRSTIVVCDPARVAFHGLRAPEPVGAMVFMQVDGRESPLPLHLQLRIHSPTGFEWGYSGSGPAQLALAMCAELVDPETALRAYQFVKANLVASLPEGADQWTITGTAVHEKIKEALAEGDA